MSVVPWSECWARPPACPHANFGGSPEGSHLLVHHLEAVAFACGRPDGSLEQQLAFLAGLCHDVGKGRQLWQQWIHRVHRAQTHGQLLRERSVPHSPAGAAFFALLSRKLLDHAWNAQPCDRSAGLLPVAQRKALEWLRMQWVRDIADHHGRLDDLNEQPPWRNTLNPTLWQEIDLPGLWAWLSTFLPWLAETPPSPTDLKVQVEGLGREWTQAWPKVSGRVQRELSLSRTPVTEAAHRLLVQRLNTAHLIWADRWDAAMADSPEVITGCVDGSPGIAAPSVEPYAERPAGRPASNRPSPPNGSCPHASTATTDRYRLNPSTARTAMDALAQHLRGPMAAAVTHPTGTSSLADTVQARRESARLQAIDAYRRRPPDTRLMSLVLPTGLGKTFTSLQVALEAVATGECSRIVYVAPYIAILSQATRDIRDATGLEVLEHHHLSVLHQLYSEQSDLSVTKATRDSVEWDIDPVRLFATDSWAAPVITTTFNQLFRALFPQSAQQSLCLSSLERSFIIIDEPQIMDGNVWNLFLKQLEAAVHTLHAQALLTTATLPPTEYGLSQDPWPLAGRNIPLPTPRYCVEMAGDANEQRMAELAVQAVESSEAPVAVILNTIGDAYRVWQLLKSQKVRVPAGSRHAGVDGVHEPAAGEGDTEESTDLPVLLLTGYMTPVHKARIIDKVGTLVKEHRPAVVISTQVLEAGVNLSFATLIRALPILSSVVQAAGRVNRHGEQAQPGKMIVARFLREGEKDSRAAVYRSRAARQATDETLATMGDSWTETDSSPLLARYYQTLITQDPQTANLSALLEAAQGRWLSVSGTEPFQETYSTAEVFVPWGERYLGDGLRALLRSFAPKGVKQLYQRYLDREWIRQLDFAQRRAFYGLLHQFTVQLPADRATQVGDFSDAEIGRLQSPDAYDDHSGLSRVATQRGEDPDDVTDCFA
ncbi:MAG: DEAD/DEAH box helicase family protein [Limnochordaceae bacterium]|nr:DEAD/DEAH box helicase family protein [Limnochordaceae bacterium]